MGWWILEVRMLSNIYSFSVGFSMYVLMFHKGCYAIGDRMRTNTALDGGKAKMLFQPIWYIIPGICTADTVQHVP